MRYPILLAAVALTGLGAASTRAQHGVPTDSIRPIGVVRASAVVDSVFVDRSLPHGFVFAGDWGAYLMARLGIQPIPPGLKIEVLADTAKFLLRTRVGDLPPEALEALGPLLGFLPPETIVTGVIGLEKIAREVVRFRLDAVRIRDFPVPDPLLHQVMAGVGKQYPALTHTGRDLLIQIPPDADVLLAPGGVLLIGPPEQPAPLPGR
jgi:hypothetical protein